MAKMESATITFTRENQQMTELGRHDRVCQGEPVMAEVGDHDRVHPGDADDGGDGSPVPSIQGEEWTRGLQSRMCRASTFLVFSKSHFNY